MRSKIMTLWKIREEEFNEKEALEKELSGNSTLLDRKVAIADRLLILDHLICQYIGDRYFKTESGVVLVVKAEKLAILKEVE